MKKAKIVVQVKKIKIFGDIIINVSGPTNLQKKMTI